MVRPSVLLSLSPSLADRVYLLPLPNMILEHVLGDIGVRGEEVGDEEVKLQGPRPRREGRTVGDRPLNFAAWNFGDGLCPHRGTRMHLEPRNVSPKK
jgi:hypothetical protein